MAGYQAFGPVQRARGSAVPEWPSRAPDPGSVPVVIEELSAATALKARVRERLAIAREQWSITTFYLFDPNSWR
jgi:hypothetical protein